MFDVKALATKQNLLSCRSFCVEPNWKVYLAETKWSADGSVRMVAIFECQNCEQLRYIDIEPPPPNAGEIQTLPMPIGKA